MIILGTIGKPETYRTLPSTVDYITLCEGWIKESPHKFLFTVFLPGIHTAWLVGVRDVIGKEMLYTTSDEAREYETRLVRYFSHREVYCIELSATPPKEEPEEEKDFSSYSVEFIAPNEVLLWDRPCFGRTKPYYPGDVVLSEDYREYQVICCNVNHTTRTVTCTVMR